MTIELGSMYLKGDKAERSVTVSGKTVTLKHVSQAHDDQKVYMENSIDFSGETEEDILKWAANSVLIGVLRKRPWKGMNSETLLKENGKTYRPCDWPANTTRKLSPEETIKRATNTMTDEQKLELIKSLNAQLNG